MRLTFEGVVFEWRGPAPFYFVRVPEVDVPAIRDVASMISYGWGVIPATVTIGSTCVTTSLFPKDGGYLVPIKNSIRLPERLASGDVIDVELSFAV